MNVTKTITTAAPKGFKPTPKSNTQSISSLSLAAVIFIRPRSLNFNPEINIKVTEADVNQQFSTATKFEKSRPACPAEVGNTSVTALLFKRGNKNDVHVVLNVRSNSTQVGYRCSSDEIGVYQYQNSNTIFHRPVTAKCDPAYHRKASVQL